MCLLVFANTHTHTHTQMHKSTQEMKGLTLNCRSEQIHTHVFAKLLNLKDEANIVSSKRIVKKEK